MDWFQISKTVIQYLWLTLGFVWLVAAFSVKRTSRTRSSGWRLLEIALAVVAFIVGFSRRFYFNSFNRTFLPDTPVVAISGLAITFIGIAFAIWARLMLGGNWSGSVTLKENHTLVRRGPYAIVRHPIYSGFLLALIGTVIVFRQLRGLVALVVAFLTLLLKSRLEEQLMTEQFGAEYAEYSQRVKALIPFIY